jgi:hypothetical protein
LARARFKPLRCPRKPPLRKQLAPGTQIPKMYLYQDLQKMLPTKCRPSPVGCGHPPPLALGSRICGPAA